MLHPTGSIRIDRATHLGMILIGVVDQSEITHTTGRNAFRGTERAVRHPIVATIRIIVVTLRIMDEIIRAVNVTLPIVDEARLVLAEIFIVLLAVTRQTLAQAVTPPIIAENYLVNVANRRVTAILPVLVGSHPTAAIIHILIEIRLDQSPVQKTRIASCDARFATVSKFR